MDAPQNKLRIDVKQNPRLKEYFSKIPDGESFHIEVDGDKVVMTDEFVECSITSIGLDGYEPPEEEGEPGELVPAPDEGVSMEITGPAKKKTPVEAP
jgi:hypothetical protein